MEKQKVSEKWLEMQRRFLTEEAFVEISIGVTETGVQDDAESSAKDNLFFADVASVTNVDSDKTARQQETTLEHNFWILDGNQLPVTDGEKVSNSGYIGLGVLTIDFSEVHNFLLPGIVITWSETFGEYATSFTVTAKNNDTVVGQTTVTDNNSTQTVVDIDLYGYNQIVISVNEWSIPGHFARIESVYIGHVLVFAKNDLVSYEHSSIGDLFSGELPKNEIKFTINNIDGRWNPSNAKGATRYLSEQQMASVRYGFFVDGGVEWIKGGRFHLNEWTASSNGIEASFSARDVFDFMIDKTYLGSGETRTLYDVVVDAFGQAEVADTVLYADEVLKNYSAVFDGEDLSIAEVIQYCSNASKCVMYQDRDGNLHVEPLEITLSDIEITSDFEFGYPEITLSKPLRNVIVKYGENQTYTHRFGNVGEDQTITNEYISNENQAKEIAEYTANLLGVREMIDVDFRADPRIDVYDVLMIPGKYGIVAGIATEITYKFSGAFHGTMKCKRTDFDDILLVTFDDYYLETADGFLLAASAY